MQRRSTVVRHLAREIAVLEGVARRRAREARDAARRREARQMTGAPPAPSDALAASIACDVRRGGTPMAAAAAHGVMPDQFARWMDAGARALEAGDATVEAAFVARLLCARDAAFEIADREVAARQEETR